MQIIYHIFQYTTSTLSLYMVFIPDKFLFHPPAITETKYSSRRLWSKILTAAASRLRSFYSSAGFSGAPLEMTGSSPAAQRFVLSLRRARSLCKRSNAGFRKLRWSVLPVCCSDLAPQYSSFLILSESPCLYWQISSFLSTPSTWYFSRNCPIFCSRDSIVCCPTFPIRWLNVYLCNFEILLFRQGRQWSPDTVPE